MFSITPYKPTVQQCKVKPTIAEMLGIDSAFEKIGVDGELHKTNCEGEFKPMTDTSDIYGDGSMVCLDELHTILEVENDELFKCDICQWTADCNALSPGGCEAYEVKT